MKKYIDITFLICYIVVKKYHKRRYTMMALCPNGKRILFLTDNIDEVSNIVHCNCAEIVHYKKDLVFNPSEKQLDDKDYEMELKEDNY